MRADQLRALGKGVADAAHPDSPTVAAGSQTFLLWAWAAAGEAFPRWGASPKARDAQLRDFWPTESFLAGAITTTVVRDAAMQWKVTGSEQVADAGAAMLRNANNGAGWEDLMLQVATDLRTQDNGAFVEFVREDWRRADSPVLGINHLDSARCYQTGVPEAPVIYEDADSKLHLLAWHQVAHLLEMPSPRTFQVMGAFWKLQYSAVTRVLQYAHIMKAVGDYDEEKITGQFTRAVHLLSGITPEEVTDAINKANFAAQNAGLNRYMQPVMAGTINPEAKVGHDTIQLANLPEGWDPEKNFKWYLTVLSLGLLTDYQEFAPLPGGNLGTSSQSEVLHRKARGKGQGLFQQIVARMINLRGVLPRGVEFEWDEADVEADIQAAEAAQKRAETRAAQIASGEITPEIARMRALMAGDLTQEEFDELKRQEVELQRQRQAEAQAQLEALRQGQQGGPQQPGVRRPAGTTTSVNEAVVEGEERTGTKANGPVEFGKLISARLHRVYAMTSDDASSLGYFPTLRDRLAVASAIGPALEVFEEALRDAGVWDMMIEPEDADRIVEITFKSLGEADEARLQFEDDVSEQISTALESVREVLSQRLAALA